MTDWIAYASEEPFGSIREDARDGTIAALIYNTNRGKNAPALGWSDFFPNGAVSRGRAQESDPERQSAKVVDLFMEFNKRFEKKGA